MLKKTLLLTTLFMCNVTTYTMKSHAMDWANSSLVTLPTEIQKTIFSYALGDWHSDGKQFDEATKLAAALQLTCKAFASINTIAKLMDINDTNKNTLLIHAAHKGIPCLVQYAIASKALLDYVEKPSGYTPLSSAVRNSNYKCCLLLLDAGADVNKVEEDEAQHNPRSEKMCPPDHYQPIHLAAGRNNIKIAELLITHGANINAQPPYKEETPLYLAHILLCIHKNPHMIDLLKKHGAKMPAWHQEYYRSFL